MSRIEFVEGQEKNNIKNDRKKQKAEKGGHNKNKTQEEKKQMKRHAFK